ncbi:hypothetical protein QBC47DRAFT_289677 [Echria macrotheca]|uniref:Uncharacterized protein n=1 Tax=Echria macrotheca TaxID=438768 RepID=A0AAJ0BMP3_9PEZI|nr:hypothetical protein QBC47DRAFT_289677 [Echria macrotheca]
MHQRPGLRRYVKTVALLSHDRIQCWSHRLPPIPAPPAIRALWMHALQHLGLPRATAVVSAAEIEEGNPGVFVALLLASLLDVRVLWLDYHLLRESDLLVGLFRGEQYFPCLERLEIWNNVDDGIVHYHPALQLSPVLSLSRLIFLQVILQREQNVAPPTLPELVELDIINHLSSPQVIATILANTPKLEKLTYFLVEDIHHLCLGGPSTAHHDEWRLFSEALTPVSKTLRILKISIDHVSPVSYSPYDWDNRWMIDLLWVFMIDHRRGPIGSLKSLRHLTKLEIPAYLLVGRHSQRLQNILPPQIEKLYLRDDYVLEGPLRNRDDDVRKMLGQYLLEKNRTIPLSLKHLRFVLRGSEYGTDHEWTDSTVNKVFGGEGRLLRLQRLARRAGIKCSLIGGKGDGSRAFWSPGLVMDEVFEVVVYDPEIEDWGVGDKYTHGWNGHLQFLRDSEREKLSRTFYNRSPRQWAYSGSVLRELFQINPLVI